MQFAAFIKSILNPGVLGVLALMLSTGTLSTCHQRSGKLKAQNELVEYKAAVELASQEQETKAAKAGVDVLSELQESIHEDSDLADSVADRVERECVRDEAPSGVPVPAPAGGANDTVQTLADLRVRAAESQRKYQQSRQWAKRVSRDLRYCADELKRFGALQDWNDAASRQD